MVKEKKQRKLKFKTHVFGRLLGMWEQRGSKATDILSWIWNVMLHGRRKSLRVWVNLRFLVRPIKLWHLVLSAFPQFITGVLKLEEEWGEFQNRVGWESRDQLLMVLKTKYLTRETKGRRIYSGSQMREYSPSRWNGHGTGAMKLLIHTQEAERQRHCGRKNTRVTSPVD